MAFLRSDATAKISQRALTFAERVTYQRAIEDVYWRHRIWPKERPDPKPSLDAVMSQAQLEMKVEDYMRKSQALEDSWQNPITAEQLQGEMDRIARYTKQPEVLRELFAALGNDAFVIAECLARQVLSERLITSFYAYDKGLLSFSRAKAKNQMPKIMGAASGNYNIPAISDAPNGCIDDTWTATNTTTAPEGRFNHTAVWTGSEMIVWGGSSAGNIHLLRSGGRYTPSTDSWAATSTTNAPVTRALHTAVWTGSEMIVWGGVGTAGVLNTGGRYTPSTDSWTATATTDAPEGRGAHTAVWTGSEMIVWGGFLTDNRGTNTGGRYNPETNSWTATSTNNAPDDRYFHTAVWTGSEMIVWGGFENDNSFANTGGRYNPKMDSWTVTSTTNAPDGRYRHTAVWTSNEMIVWGGSDFGSFNTGGRYNPSTDSWAATSTNNTPTARYLHTAVWTQREMIIWGGTDAGTRGGRYNPSTDSWAATSTIDPPAARDSHTAVWTGSEMIVWGGEPVSTVLNTGGRYCAHFGVPTPTPTASPTATPTPSSTPRPTPTPRSAPTPRPRPTPVPRP